MTTERRCPECSGTGLLWSPFKMEEAPCHRCKGEGVVQVLTQVFGAPSGVPANEKLTREELNYEPDSNMSDGNPSDYGD